jgi:hypothetical protein
MVTTKSDPGPPDSELANLLLTAFGRALVHKLRTPLSVISNELAYMRASSDFSDHVTIEKKCAQIEAELAAISAACSLGGAFEKIEIENIVQEFFGALKQQGGGSSMVFCQPNSLKYCLKTLVFELLPRLNAADKELSFSCSNEPEFLSIRAQFDLKQAAYLDSAQPQHATTFSFFFSSILGLDLISAPIVDAILIMHGISLSLYRQDKKLGFELHIPTCDKKPGVLAHVGTT